MNFRFRKPISWFISLVSAAAAPMIFASEVNRMGCYVNFVEHEKNIHCSKCNRLLSECCAQFMCENNCPKCIVENLYAACYRVDLSEEHSGPCWGTMFKSGNGQPVYERFINDGVFYFSSDLLIKEMGYPTAGSWFEYCENNENYEKNTYCAYCMKEELDDYMKPSRLRTCVHVDDLGNNGKCGICFARALNANNTYGCKACGKYLCATCFNTWPTNCSFCRAKAEKLTKVKIRIIPDNMPIETEVNIPKTEVDYIPKNVKNEPQNDFNLLFANKHDRDHCCCCTYIKLRLERAGLIVESGLDSV